MRRLVLIPLLLLAALTATAQDMLVPLTGTKGGTGLNLNLDRIWNYNLYERSRWGVGLDYIIAHDSVDNATDISGYVGYGIRDRQLKGGVGVLHFDDGRVFYAHVYRDYDAAASRSSVSTTQLNLNDLSGFMASRMSDNVGLRAGYYTNWGRVGVLFGTHLFFGGRLFDGDGLLYRCLGDTIAPENGAEAKVTTTYGKHLEAVLACGHTWPQGKPIVRLLAFYEHADTLSFTELYTYLQGGITPPNTPYIRMFDLGGTYGAPLFFPNALLTAKPNEFTANTFLLASLRLRLHRPLYQLHSDLLVMGSRPRPFVGINAAWGWLWGQNPDGQMCYEGLDLQSPHRGVMEAVVGIDGLFEWGAVDYGVAFSCRPYPLENNALRWSVLVTAELSI